LPYKDPEKSRQNKKEYYLKNKEKLTDKNHDWYLKNREKILKINKEKYKENKKEILMKNREWRMKNKEKIREWWRNIRLEVLSHYSDKSQDFPRCTCCGETEFNFLSIDHIHGGGNQHRKQIKVQSGYKFYYWLKKNNFPDGYQVLCMNCNWGKRMNNRICPHQTKKEMLVDE